MPFLESLVYLSPEVSRNFGTFAVPSIDGVSRTSPVRAMALSLGHRLPASRPGRLLFPQITGIEAGNTVALTFDDGPDLGSGRFLDVMEDSGARATFFVVGEQVERAPEYLAEVVARGHRVGVHCHRHVNHRRLSPTEVVEDMRRARAVIEEAAGCTVGLFRPPAGFFSLSTWLEAGRQDWDRVLWTFHRDARDWQEGATPHSILENIGTPRDGDIILMHDSDRYAAPDSWRTTLETLPALLELLGEHGLETRLLGEGEGSGST